MSHLKFTRRSAGVKVDQTGSKPYYYNQTKKSRHLKILWKGQTRTNTRRTHEVERIIMVDAATRKTLSNLPLLKTKAGPRDKDLWPSRLKEEYQALIQYVNNNKESDNDWFRLESNKDGTRWFGKCWYIHELLKYEFDIEFDIPVTYPQTAPEIALPELDGKTAKMYRGGKICLTDHFKPLWAKNVPKFGIGHAMALGLGPWLAVEIPDLVSKSVISYKEKTEEAASK